MEQRIKTIRKSNNLTQTEFGKRIGVKGNTVTNYETGLRIPSEAVILAICREFDVSERWLRTGEGVMLVERSADEKLAAFLGDVLSRGPEDFRRRCLETLSRLKPEEWYVLEHMIEKTGSKKGSKKTGPKGAG
ncbi:MAG: helix-turn-helix transcriptional regulator [Oscillospiraceae bacterium]|jgi:transcriptional regulator with XRE-family HTH domain|nr:helix-turn-helix transcriptional regulator [Oscillospiraceae bacterium]